MEKLSFFFIIAVLSSGVLGLSFRNKRQAEEQEALEDRYGWNRPNRPNPPGSDRFNQISGPIQGQFQAELSGPFQGRFQGHFTGQFVGKYVGQFPDQLPTTYPTASTTVPTPNVNSSIEDCIRNCPVTPEYNPVCGSNSVTYDNPGRLLCAQACGVSVIHQRSSRCPTPVAS